MSHDAERPVTAHVRVRVATPDEQRLVESIAAETVRWNRARDKGPISSLDVLVTAEQLQELAAKGFKTETIAPVWTQEELKKQVSQGDRYRARVEELKRKKSEK